MFKRTCPTRSFLSLPDLDTTAHKTDLVIRKTAKFTPAGFLQSLLGCVVTGLASFNQLAGSLKDFTRSAMSRQSLHDRFSTRSTAFLMTVLHDLMGQRFQKSADALGTSPIRRILIEDASRQVMPKSNAGTFPAHGNHHGPTAGVKIDFAFDLLAGNALSHSLHQATAQDKTICKDFLKRNKHDIIDTEVLVGADGEKCRLVAVRAASDVAKARRAQGREEKRQNRLSQGLDQGRLAPHVD